MRTYDNAYFSKDMLVYYDKLFRKPMDFSELSEPLPLFFQRIDYYLSIKSAVSGKNIDHIISEIFSGGLLAYSKFLLKYGFLGNFGFTVDPASFLLNFPTTKITLLWIPKNSCTSTKKLLLSFEPKSAVDRITPPLFHERCQESFGLNAVQIAEERLFPLVTIVRNPYERLVSCYLDKFAKPVIENRPFEKFIEGHIIAAHNKLGIGTTNINRSLTFSEFVAYIDRMPPWSFDAHWRPQACFIQGFRTIARVIPIERQDEIWAILGLQPKATISNRSFGGRFNPLDPLTGEFAHALPGEINPAKINNYNSFINPDTLHIISKHYGNDLEIYNESVTNFERS